MKFFWKQIAAPKNERGSNALALYLAKRAGTIVNPATVDLIREIPDTLLPLMPLDREKGHRFTNEQWLQYQHRSCRAVATGN